MAGAGFGAAAEAEPADHRAADHGRRGAPGADRRRRTVARSPDGIAGIVNQIDRTERDAHIAGFLLQAGWGAAERGLLAGDASFRRYDRLNLEGRTAVLMDAPPPMENVGPFINVATLLGGLGFSTPRILAEDRA